MPTLQLTKISQKSEITKIHNTQKFVRATV